MQGIFIKVHNLSLTLNVVSLLYYFPRYLWFEVIHAYQYAVTNVLQVYSRLTGWAGSVLESSI